MPMSIKLKINLQNYEISQKVYTDKNPKILNSEISKDIVKINDVSMYKYSDNTSLIIKNSVFNKDWKKFILEEEKNIVKNAVFKYPKEHFNRYIYFLNNNWCIISNNTPEDTSDEMKNFIFIPTKSLNLNLVSAIMGVDPYTQWTEAKLDLVNAYACFISSLDNINDNIYPTYITIQFNSIYNQHVGSIHGHFSFKNKKT